MAVSRAKKAEVLESLSSAFKNSEAIVFVHFKGLTVKDVTEMRRKFRATGVGYTVAKKTLMKRALNDAKYQGEMPELSGEMALAYSKDLIAPAREVYEFQKKFKDLVKIEGGVFQGAYKSKEEMMQIAMIPSRDTLLGMFVNVINSPIQGLVIALDGIGKKKV